MRKGKHDENHAITTFSTNWIAIGLIFNSFPQLYKVTVKQNPTDLN